MDKNRIIENLMIYFGESSEDIISLLVDLSCQNVVNRRYPFGYTEDQEQAAISQYSNVVFRAVVYAYEKGGITSHASLSENGTSRSFIDEDKLYAEIVPVCVVL